MRITVRQTIPTGHHIVTAANKIRQPRMRTDPRVDHGHLLPGATAKPPRLSQIQHVHVMRLHPVVSARQGTHLGAKSALAHRLIRARRPIRRRGAHINLRRLHRPRRRGTPQPCQSHHRGSRYRRTQLCTTHRNHPSYRYRIAANTPISQKANGKMPVKHTYSTHSTTLRNVGV